MYKFIYNLIYELINKLTYELIYQLNGNSRPPAQRSELTANPADYYSPLRYRGLKRIVLGQLMSLNVQMSSIWAEVWREKMSESQTKAGNQKKIENLKICKFENLKI